MVKTIVKASTIPEAGLGLFADEFISKGTVTWRYCPNFDQILYEDDLLRMSEAARTKFLKYCYKNIRTGHYVLSGDDESFINHSDNPNIMEGEIENELETFSVALRDIEKGEELFCNYFDFDANAEKKLKNEFY